MIVELILILPFPLFIHLNTYLSKNKQKLVAIHHACSKLIRKKIKTLIQTLINALIKHLCAGEFFH